MSSIYSTNTGLLWKASVGLEIRSNVSFLQVFNNETNTCTYCLVPPFGWSEGTDIQDIFQVDHLLANSRLLDTSCSCSFLLQSASWCTKICGAIDRLPIPIAKYISKAVYKGELKHDPRHKGRFELRPVVFVDVHDGEEFGVGTSFAVSFSSIQTITRSPILAQIAPYFVTEESRWLTGLSIFRTRKRLKS